VLCVKALSCDDSFHGGPERPRQITASAVDRREEWRIQIGADSTGELGMQKLLTSDQFVAGIVAMLALKERKHFRLSDTELDRRFQEAYEELVGVEKQYGVRLNFSFYVDPFHGDSVCLRDTLHAAKEKELIAYNNPTLRTFDVKLSQARAEGYLARNPLPRDFFDSLVDRHFPPD
jgi:hypothetical protein